MRTLLAAVFLAAAGPLTAVAADCAATQRGCLAQCDTAYPPRRDDLGHAGCAARCAWESTTCTAQEALDQTQTALDRDLRPWLDDQAAKWQRFLDGFRGDRPAEPPRSRPPGSPGVAPGAARDRGTSL
jgi:hypothetical protein